MRNIFIALILFCLLLSCESEQEKKSKTKLSISVNTLNNIYRDFHDNASAESQLSALTVRDFYSTYLKRLSELRQSLYSDDTIDELIPLRNQLDTLITYSIYYFNIRQSCVFTIYSVTNSMADYRTNLENFRSSYSQLLSITYRIRALEAAIAFMKNKSEQEYAIQIMQSIVSKTQQNSVEFNSHLKTKKIKDSLNFHISFKDSNDVLINTWKKIKNIRLDIPE